MAEPRRPNLPPTARIGASYALVGNAGRLIISAVGALVIAGMIGPANKGVLATLSVLSTMVAIILSFSADETIRYYVATRSWSLAQSNSVALGLTSVMSAIAFLGYKAAIAVIPGNMLTHLSSVELTAATAIVLLSLFAGQALDAMRMFSFTARLGVVSALACPALFFVLRLVGVATLPSALWAWIGGQAAFAVPGQVWLLHMGSWRFALPDHTRGALWYGVRCYGGRLFNLANLRLDVLMLRGLSTASATGSYSLIAQVTEAVWVLPTSVGVAVFPEIAQGGHEHGDWTARVCRLTSALSAMAAVAVGGASTLLIAYALPAYRSALPALWLLLPGTVVASVSQILNRDLSARHLPQAGLAGAALALAVTVIGDLLLIPSLGIAGAALVSSLAYAVNTLALVGFFFVATRSPVTALVPRSADVREAVRLATRTVREFARRRSAIEAS